MGIKMWISVVALAMTVAGGTAVAPVQAQTASDINRLNQAMQICNSPLGASVPECAQLRGQLGAGAGAGLGALLGRQPQQPYGNPANAAAAQQVYVACVQRAGLNQQMLAACNLALQSQMGGGGGGNYAQQGADATLAATQAYRNCVAQNPAAWQGCMSAFGGGAPGIGNVPPPPAPARPAAPYDPFAPPRP